MDNGSGVELKEIRGVTDGDTEFGTGDTAVTSPVSPGDNLVTRPVTGGDTDTVTAEFSPTLASWRALGE